MTDQTVLPDPARDALDEPRLDAEDLEQEIGDAEEWDESSEINGDEEPTELP